MSFLTIRGKVDDGPARDAPGKAWSGGNLINCREMSDPLSCVMLMTDFAHRARPTSGTKGRPARGRRRRA
jgi:hypothetical protein